MILLLTVGLTGALTAGTGWRVLRWPGRSAATVGPGTVPDRPIGSATDPESGTVSDHDLRSGSTSDPRSAENSGADSAVSEPGFGASTGRAVTQPVRTATPIRTAKPIRASARLRTELTEALDLIGQARADAFELVSAGRLEHADLSGSPALRADLGLLERLRRNGYRLEELHYRVDRVRLRSIDRDTVEVAAQVSTSAHRQVRVGSGTAAGVAPSGPADLVFTLRAVGNSPAGARRWRVVDVVRDRR